MRELLSTLTDAGWVGVMQTLLWYRQFYQPITEVTEWLLPDHVDKVAGLLSIWWMSSALYTKSACHLMPHDCKRSKSCLSPLEPFECHKEIVYITKTIQSRNGNATSIGWCRTITPAWIDSCFKAWIPTDSVYMSDSELHYPSASQTSVMSSMTSFGDPLVPISPWLYRKTWGNRHAPLYVALFLVSSSSP